MKVRTGNVARAIAPTVILGLVLATQSQIIQFLSKKEQLPAELAVLVAAAIFGSLAIRAWIPVLFNGHESQPAVVARNLSTWTMWGLLVLLELPVLGVNLSGFLLGGAVVGVVLATISQASLSNFFAGLILIGARPYTVGSSVRMRSSMAGGAEYEGTVTDVGALFTTLLTAQGEILKIPNSAIMTAALIVGQEPLQADVGIELEPGTPVEPIVDRIRRELKLNGQAVTLRPQTLTTGDQTRLACRLEIRSRHPIDPVRLAGLLADSISARRPVGV